ncbi:MAG TPA: Gfo/Idh/MocA family oxidoreductase [Bryobacteraceae bacterium]|jgi:predicted dehydrogenase|nr:Gfo/Idh/MocA family oxidoreductase [Bryobacteraceae bacterium]
MKVDYPMKSVAIIGLGAVVRNIHIPAYAQLSGRVRVVAGCDPNNAAREYARDKWRLQTFKDPKEMIEGVHPDVVAICTPPWLHREQALLALDHGCHVFCEKPLAEDLAQADDMVRASERAGRLMVVNNQFPYMNIHLAAKKQIGTKDFGELLYLHAWHTMRTDEVTEAGWRGELSRRLCFEFGTHVFELLRFFFEDTPIRLLAHMPNPGGRAKCDVINVIAMEFADGRGASIVLDRVSQGQDRYLDMRLDGESAIVHTSIGGRVQVEAGIHTRERRPFLNFTLVKGGKAEWRRGSRSKLIAKDGINPFGDATARHFARFLDAIQDGGTPPGNVRDNRNTLALVMAAYDSAASGKWVEVKQYAYQEPAARI